MNSLIDVDLKKTLDLGVCFSVHCGRWGGSKTKRQTAQKLNVANRSWLNLVESAFSKMARTFLRHIRVNSKEELKNRILQGINEINSSPVVHRWKKFDLAIV